MVGCFLNNPGVDHCALEHGWFWKSLAQLALPGIWLHAVSCDKLWHLESEAELLEIVHSTDNSECSTEDSKPSGVNSWKAGVVTVVRAYTLDTH